MSSNSPQKWEAAVAIIYTGQKPNREFLVLKRTSPPEDPWGGQLAFPGGKTEPEDISFLDTAIRETEEEIGVFLIDSQLISQLPVHYAGKSSEQKLPVQPFLFALSQKPELTLNADEFVKEFWVSEQEFLKTEKHLSKQPLPSLSKSFPGFPIQDEFLWGFTYEVMLYISQNDC